MEDDDVLFAWFFRFVVVFDAVASGRRQLRVEWWQQRRRRDEEKEHDAAAQFRSSIFFFGGGTKLHTRTQFFVALLPLLLLCLL